MSQNVTEGEEIHSDRAAEVSRGQSRSAGCGPACPVVWQGRRGDPSPYADFLSGGARATGGQVSRIPADSTKGPFSAWRICVARSPPSAKAMIPPPQARKPVPQKKLIADESMRVSIDEAPHDVRNLVPSQLETYSRWRKGSEICYANSVEVIHCAHVAALVHHSHARPASEISRGCCPACA
jgi:hypothetical protein